jgi:hypothetical protein
MRFGRANLGECEKFKKNQRSYLETDCESVFDGKQDSPRLNGNSSDETKPTDNYDDEKRNG